MKLVLQCAMCGTHHPVGTLVCSTCRASGVTQLRLMFECPACGHLGINPVCQACLPVVPPYEVVEPAETEGDLIVAEEVVDGSLTPDDDDFTLELDEDDGEEEDEKVVVDLSEEADEDEWDDLDLDDLDDSDVTFEDSDVYDSDLDDELEDSEDDLDELDSDLGEWDDEFDEEEEE